MGNLFPSTDPLLTTNRITQYLDHISVFTNYRGLNKKQREQIDIERIDIINRFINY